MNFHTQPTKISGVNFPPGCPRDFADQVRMMVRKHNQTVEDLLTYEQTVRELEGINADLRLQLKKSKTSNTELLGKYNVLKDVSEKLASKYEKLVSSRNPVPEQPSQLSRVVSNTKSQKIQSENMVRELASKKDAPQVVPSAHLSDDEKSSAVKAENSTSEKSDREDDDEELVEIESSEAEVAE